MAVAIRLNRQGSKDRPYYKIVVVDSARVVTAVTLSKWAPMTP